MNWISVSRGFAALILCVWAFSLCVPSYATPIEEGDGIGSAARIEVYYGWSVLLLGWGTLFEPMFAWFANPILLWGTYRLALGGPKSLAKAMFGWVCAFFAVFVAWTGFQPTHIQFGDDHGVNGLSHPLWGAYVWAASIAGLLIAMTAAVGRNAMVKSGK